MFDQIVGNDVVKGYLEAMVRKGSVGNSLLFAGPDGVGKSLFAEALAAELFGSPKQAQKVKSGNHPDLYHYRPQGKVGMHSIDSMRSFCQEVNLAPYEGARKVFIIHDAHRMLTYSANALLKTYEEPSLDSVIILLSDQPETLLPTVRSRCRTLRFHAIAEEEIAAYLIGSHSLDRDKARAIAANARGSIARALELLHTSVDRTTEQLFHLLENAANLPYHQLVEGVKEICDIIEKEKSDSETTIKEHLLNGVSADEMTAYQREALQKEVEGAATMHNSLGAYRLFDHVLYWYRDLHLLYHGGAIRLLYHRDKSSILQSLALKTEPPPLETVSEAVSTAKLNLDRSAPLSLCLENLLLKLSLM